MGLLDGKVAFVTGAARGQGRSHAVRLTREGCDIIALDACAMPDWLSYPLATEADLAQTVKEVEALDRRIVARKADIRDLAAVTARGPPSSAAGWTSSPPTRRSSPGRRTPGRLTWPSSAS